MPKKTNKSLLPLGLAMIVIIAVAFASKSASTSAELVASSPAVEVSNANSETAQSFTYNGKHSDWVRKLLTRVGGWKCPANASESGTPPKVKAEECSRDASVAAAVLYAWAAECYARNEEDSKAEEAAEQMYKRLESVQELCSGAPSVGGGGKCDTEDIFGCGEL